MRVTHSEMLNVRQDIRKLVTTSAKHISEEIFNLDWNIQSERNRILEILMATSSVFRSELESIIVNGIVRYIQSNISEDGVDMESILSKAVKEVEKPFKGKSLSSRTKRISKLISKTGELLIQSNIDLLPQFMGRSYSVGFGSVYKQSLRLAYSEMSRSLMLATIILGKSTDKKRVAWELDSSHHIYDICDELVGEYDIEDCPDYPHPYCKCHIVLLK